MRLGPPANPSCGRSPSPRSAGRRSSNPCACRRKSARMRPCACRREHVPGPFVSSWCRSCRTEAAACPGRSIGAGSGSRRCGHAIQFGGGAQALARVFLERRAGPATFEVRVTRANCDACHRQNPATAARLSSLVKIQSPTKAVRITRIRNGMSQTMAGKYKISATPLLHTGGDFKGKLKGVSFTAVSPRRTHEWFSNNCGQFELTFSRIMPRSLAHVIVASLMHGDEVGVPRPLRRVPVRDWLHLRVAADALRGSATVHQRTGIK